MRSLLEKATDHLLNGDETKAAAMFHKFIVERAREIHNALRENDGSMEGLDENWDQEITEEEYFDDSDLHEDKDDDDDDVDPALMSGSLGAEAPPSEVAGDPAPTVGPDDAGIDGDDFDADGDGDLDDAMGDEFGDDAELDTEAKIDELSAKLDQLIAELEGGGDMPGDDLPGDDLPGDDIGDATMDDESAQPPMSADGDDSELAGRMSADMGDDDDDEFDREKAVAESEGDDDDDMMEDDDLDEITESVLDELEKISTPEHTEGKVSGKGEKAHNPLTLSPLPHHGVNDRVGGEPVMTKGPTHKGHAREASPTVASPDTLVKGVRKANRRDHWTDTTEEVSDMGDAKALIHKNHSGTLPTTRSTLDGKKKKG